MGLFDFLVSLWVTRDTAMKRTADGCSKYHWLVRACA